MLDRKMYTFARLAQTGSYTATAQQLFVTQPAVTQQIKALENELGLALVSYEHAQLTITPAGQQLADYINKIDHESQKLLMQLQTPAQPIIKLGCTRSLSAFLLTSVLQQLQAQGQQIRCQIANTDTILKALTAGTIDFGLVEGNFDKNKFASIRLRREPFIGVTFANNPSLKQKQPLNLNELLTQTLLVREPGSGTREIFANWLTMQNAQITDFKQVIEIATPTPIIQLLTAGCGISFMYQSLVTTELAHGQLVKLSVRGFELQHEINLVYPKDSYFAAQYQAIAAQVIQ